MAKPPTPNQATPGVPTRHQRVVEQGPSRRVPQVPSDSPPPPPRRTFTSEPGTGEPPTWRDFRELDKKIDAVETKVDGIVEGQVDFKLTLTKMAASNRSDNMKLLGTVVVAALGVIGGSKALTPAPPAPPQPVLVRSAYDRALEQCQKLEGDDARGRCITKVAVDAASRER